MKKLITILTITTMFFTASSFTTFSDNVPAKVKSAFDKNFPAALNTSWGKSATDNLYFANFSFADCKIKAVFNAEGDLLSTSREIDPSALPLKIILAVEKKYSGYKLDKAFELITDDGDVYHLVISNDKERIKIMSDASGNIEKENAQ